MDGVPSPRCLMMCGENIEEVLQGGNHLKPQIRSQYMLTISEHLEEWDISLTIA